MNKNEKILLLQLILEDIRGNWADYQEERIEGALELANELVEIQGIQEMIGTIECYDYEDGRYFREEYPYGYIDMEKLHGLERTFYDKSEEFRDKTLKLLTYPECRFNDWKED